MSLPSIPTVSFQHTHSECEMGLPLDALLPLKSVVVTLECTGYIKLPFMRYDGVYQLIESLLAETKQSKRAKQKKVDLTDLCKRLIVFCPETHYAPYQAKERYRFQVSVLKGDEALLDKLIWGLKHVSRRQDSEPLPSSWHDKIAFISANDLYTGRTINKSEECSDWGMRQITEEALYWQGQDKFCWQWLTPVLSKLYDPDGRDDSNQPNQHVLAPATLFAQVYTYVAERIQMRVPALNLTHQLPSFIRQDKATLFQVAMTNSPDIGRLGKIHFSGTAALPFSWWCLLVFAQKLGLAPDNQHGKGHFILAQPDGYSPHHRLKMQNRLTDAIGSTHNLRTALNHVRKYSQQGQKRPSHYDDGILAPDEILFAYDFAADHPVLAELEQHLQEIQCSHYQTPALRGWLIEKKDGGYRPLAVPPFNDRVLQRAVAQKLTPVLDRLMNKGSFGYRPRRSRKDAMQEIAQAVRDGFCWVFESDLKDFFDSVELKHLEMRLVALFGDQPVIRQILHWMAADVVFRGEVINRCEGLPQGSPLSPLLANLMLDHYDHSMEQAGFRLIRFADDFVVMCKSAAQAKAAKQRTEQVLSSMDLALNPEKTHIREVRDGLRFLGYLFVNQSVLDVSGEKPPVELKTT